MNELDEYHQKPIDAPILHNSPIRGLQTILWFIRTIRPLYLHAATSDYLFPAVKEAGKHLSYGTFTGWWYPAVRHRTRPRRAAPSPDPRQD